MLKNAEGKCGSAIAALGDEPRYGDLLDLQAQAEQLRELLSGFKHELQACEHGMRVEGGQPGEGWQPTRREKKVATKVRREMAAAIYLEKPKP